jgi:hypothetical protein
MYGAIGETDVESRAIGVREHRDRLDIEIATGSDDSNGNLAPVGHEHPANLRAAAKRI